MGHKAGWLALYAGIAGGGDVILHTRDTLRLRGRSPRHREAPFRRASSFHRGRRRGRALQGRSRPAEEGTEAATREDDLPEHRLSGRRGNPGADRHGDARHRARLPAARRHAEPLRPGARDDLRDGSRRAPVPRPLWPDGRHARGKHRHRAALGGRRQDQDDAPRPSIDRNCPARRHLFRQRLTVFSAGPADFPANLRYGITRGRRLHELHLQTIRVEDIQEAQLRIWLERAGMDGDAPLHERPGQRFQRT